MSNNQKVVFRVRLAHLPVKAIITQYATQSNVCKKKFSTYSHTKILIVYLPKRSFGEHQQVRGSKSLSLQYADNNNDFHVSLIQTYNYISTDNFQPEHYHLNTGFTSNWKNKLVKSSARVSRREREENSEH